MSNFVKTRVYTIFLVDSIKWYANLHKMQTYIENSLYVENSFRIVLCDPFFFETELVLLGDLR